jgi:pyrroloquinoline quinone biosynthesis protein B
VLRRRDLTERRTAIRVRLLGTAAGGGLPQWNCSCTNCCDARAKKIPSLTQSCIGITGNGREWLLINASPDLPHQIETIAATSQPSKSLRHSFIAAVCLTNADIDHALGLILMRQQDDPLTIYASASTRTELHWVDNLLAPFRLTDWREPPHEFCRIIQNVDLRIVNLGSSVACCVRNPASKKQALIAPAVRELTDELHEVIQNADAIVFDGTFWTNYELKPFRDHARSAREMGHIPVEESLSVLQRAPAACKIYTHINNTNPMLQPGSAENLQSRAAGIAIGQDGFEFQL